MSDLYISTIGLPILLNRSWDTEIAHRHMKVETGPEGAIPFLGINKWDFLGSVGHGEIAGVSRVIWLNSGLKR